MIFRSEAKPRLRLEPVVECWPTGAAFDWQPEADGRDFFRLHAEMPEADVAAVFALLASYNGAVREGSVADAAQGVVAAERLILPGGLLARIGAAEVGPGCCNGLEDWRDWQELGPGCPAPWMGHDPSPTVECGPREAVLVADSADADAARYALEYDEIASAVAQARSDLTGFLTVLERWLSARTDLAAEVVQKVGQAFHISTPE